MTLKSGKSALKINKDSHFIKKSSSSSLSVTTTTTTKPSQHRQPVIIYTHSPRIIQTHPSNFMELVQKLTGLSHAAADDDDDEVVPCKPPQPPPPREEPEENEAASSVITTEDLDVGTEVKSSFVALQQQQQQPQPPPPPIINMPHYVNMFENIAPPHFLCSNNSIYNFPDPSIMF